MREILFRGKRVDNGEWICGNLYQCEEDSEGYVRNLITPKKRNGSPYMVDEKTVGQYTGLTDKRGAKIFESDIVRAQFNSNNSIHNFFVSYADGFYIFDNGSAKVTAKDIYNLKVVGNIHDNPDMLIDK